MCLVSGLSVLALMVPGAAVADRMRLEQPDEKSMRGLHIPPPPIYYNPPRTLFTRSRTVYNLPGPISQFAIRDARLSRLCQVGAFIQQSDGFYAARTPGKRYGVAFSGGANLDDAENRRRPGKVYFFDGQDSRCTVWVQDQKALQGNYIPD